MCRFVHTERKRWEYVPERVEHSNEQVLLLCVREELDKHRAAMVAAHGKTGSLVFVSGTVQDLCKAPVYLERFSGPCLITPSPVALRLHQMLLGGYQVLMCGDRVLYRRDSPWETSVLQSFQANDRIGHTVLEH